jgi:hypothetical protein
LTKKPKPALVRAARLDEHGVYQGMDDLPASELTPHHLSQISDCDLPPGGYRWDGQTFVPLPKRLAERALKEPDTLRAIAAGLNAVRAAGIALPPETTAWLAWHAASFDAKG